MKYGLSILSVMILSFSTMAQDKKTIKKENFFTGGNITASFFTGGIVLGANPYFGYSITSWLDAAISLNYNYTGQTDQYSYKYRQHVISPGAFVRIFPIESIFLQGQLEHNFLKLKVTAPNGSPENFNAQTNSFLVGAGYASGRQSGNNNFFYFSVMYDLFQQPNSPYVDSYDRAIPIVNAGFNIALFQGGDRKK